MKDTIVIYTRYDSTRRYAQWLAEELEADIKEQSQAGIKDLLP